jgi:RNA polymerase primary sigma factor
MDKRGLNGEETLEVYRLLQSANISPIVEDEYLGSFGRKSTRELDDLLGRYLQEISGVRLLVANEEIILARRIRAGEKAKETLSSSGETENTALLQVIDEGKRAEERMILANLRLVVSIARKYDHLTHLSLLDLIQDGTFGLFRAIRGFDHRMGYKFSTYATWWIRQQIHRAISNRESTIRLPVHIAELARNVKKAKESLATDNGGVSPSPHQVADHLGISTKTLSAIEMAEQEPLSLDQPAQDDESNSIGHFIEDTINETPETIFLKKEMTQALLGVHNLLTQKQKDVLRLRFGLEDGVGRTLEEIGQIYNVTRERIRQIESKALERLRKRLGTPEMIRFFGFPVPARASNESTQNDRENRNGPLRSSRNIRTVARRQDNSGGTGRRYRRA